MKRISLLTTLLLLTAAVSLPGCKKGKKNDEAAKPADQAGATDQAADDKAGADETKPADQAAGDEAAAGDQAAAGDEAAAGGDQAAAAGAAAPTAEEQAMAEKAVAMMDELGKIADADKGNCDKAATDMKAVVDKNKDLIAAGKSFDKDPAKKKWFEEKYGAKMLASASKMMPLMEKCQKNENLKKVFESMGN